MWIYLDGWMIASGDVEPIAVGDVLTMGVECAQLRASIDDRDLVTPVVLEHATYHLLVEVGEPPIRALMSWEDSETRVEVGTRPAGEWRLMAYPWLGSPADLLPDVCQHWVPELTRRWRVEAIEEFDLRDPHLAVRVIQATAASTDVEQRNYRLLCTDIGQPHG